MRVRSVLTKEMRGSLKQNPFQKALTFRTNKRGTVILEPCPVPSYTRTEAQDQQRNFFRQALNAWLELSEAEKEQWNEQARPYGITGMNLYISQYEPVTGEWIRPASHEDENGTWADESDAYDGSLTTCAVGTCYYHYLILYPQETVLCSKLRFYAEIVDGPHIEEVKMTLQIKYGGEWHDMGVITGPRKTWFEVDLGGEYNLEAYKLANAHGPFTYFYLYETEMYVLA